MGRRGKGAKPLAKSDEIASKRRRFPWQKPGLSRADRVIAFLQFLPITKGILVGKKMKLLPDQIDFIRRVYVDDASVRMGIDSKPRGNGKTGATAGIALCHLLGPESEPRGEIYSAAVDRTQSSKIFQEMAAIIDAVPEFSARANVIKHTHKIEVESGDGIGSTYEALSADGRKGNSLAPTLWIYDELAQVSNFELLDNLETALGKRTRSLGLVISTQAESDEHRLSVMIDDALSGVDPTIVCQLIAAPPDADPFDESVLRAVNPALGIFLHERDLIAEMKKAQRIPAFEARFRNRRLNQRVDANQENRILPAAVWNSCASAVDRASLRGRTCFGGLDLSGKHDLSALVLVFPDDAKEPSYDILPIFWTPQGQLEARRARERDNFKLWISQGYIKAVPGPVIRFDWIAAELAKLSAEFNIRAISYDRWRVDDLKLDLADADCSVPLEPRGQGFKDAGPDIEILAELAMSGRLRHGNNPVLRAAMSNAITVSDPAGNLKVDKDRSNGRGPVRIDAAVALAMACGVATRTPPPKVSVYRSRGLLTLPLGPVEA